MVPPPQVVGPRPAPRLHAPPPPGNAAHHNPAGAADGSPRPDTVTGSPSASSRSAGNGGSNTRAGAGPGTAPGQGQPSRRSPASSRDSPHGTQRIRSTGVRPPAGDRGDDRVGTEHPLHPGEGAPGTVGGGGVTAPEPELAPGGGAEVVGHEPQQ